MGKTEMPLLRAHLHHIAIESPDPEHLARFYTRALGFDVQLTTNGLLGVGCERRIVFVPGNRGELSWAAYAVEAESELQSLRVRLAGAGWPSEDNPADLFEASTVCVRDPDGNRIVFGLPKATGARADYETAAARAARLQHVVVSSRDVQRLADFYQAPLGFSLSDEVVGADGVVRTSFLRSSDEHHSFAVFQADQCRFDHHCYEAGDWMLIRDWADHFSSEDIPLQWGPGRHGPGGNLFVFIHDSDGNWVEVSAELERVKLDHVAGTWPHEERTLNQWGRGLLRS